jgi:xanthine dehydrogenase small subunit
MNSTLRFLVNDAIVETQAWPGSPALDFIRRDLGLTGVKEGCREGDCGACAVLLGKREGGSVRYRAVPSCLLALGELEGNHLVTIEGLREGGQSSDGITPVMRALLDENGSQCGFCTPGFVISLTAFLLEGPPLSLEAALTAVEGNLCRCTGYGAIKRAAARLVHDFGSVPKDYFARLTALETAGVVPQSLGAFARGELLPAASSVPAETKSFDAGGRLVLGGGTDFYVRNPDPRVPASHASVPLLLDRDASLRRIERRGGMLELGAALAWRDFFADAEVRALAPGIERFERELASILVRNRATLGGNVANASPIADAVSMLIALGAIVRLTQIDGGGSAHDLPLERFYRGYKQLDMAEGEMISAFLLPADRPVLFNFEKVAKRARLDIASVNSAAALVVDMDRITYARISAGGVAPTPLLLSRTSAFLLGKRADAATVNEAAQIAIGECAPIGDVRGSAEYRRTLLGRLVVAHFERLFPGSGIAEEALS